MEEGECCCLSSSRRVCVCPLTVSYWYSTDIFSSLFASVLHPDVECRFESNMTVVRMVCFLLNEFHALWRVCSKSQHKHFNTLLNNLKINSSQPGYASSTPLDYHHLYLVDTFYPSSETNDRDKIRVTRDEKTGNVLECMRKIRLGDLNIHSPKRPADWRISVNLEVPGELFAVFGKDFLRIGNIHSLNSTRSSPWVPNTNTPKGQNELLSWRV